jgi:hypothetical protein
MAMYEAMYDFNPESPDLQQLELKTGRIYIIAASPSGEPVENWEFVTDSVTGKSGYIPSSYVGPSARQHGFGIPLLALLNEGETVPQLVTHLIAKAVELGAQTKSGIFRWPGNHRQMEQSMAAVNGGADIADLAVLDHCDVGSVAGLLTKWIRQLPEHGKLICVDRHSEGYSRMVGGANSDFSKDEAWELLTSVANHPTHVATLRAVRPTAAGIVAH